MSRGVSVPAGNSSPSSKKRESDLITEIGKRSKLLNEADSMNDAGGQSRNISADRNTAIDAQGSNKVGRSKSKGSLSS